MQSEAPLSNNQEPPRDIPPVIPPSGRHIVQLFVVPGLIVLGIVLIFYLFSQFLFPWFLGVSRTPQQFLANLESTNPDVRWRAANDLAQVLKRDDDLASDADFGLRLCTLLKKALDDMEETERNLAEKGPTMSAKDHEAERRSFLAKRNYALFLSACLGNMNIPVGVPLLKELAVKGRGKDDKTNVLVRRRAVWALANLGDNISKRYPPLPEQRKAGVLAFLSREQDSQEADQAEWARFTLAALEERQPMGVVAALAECANARDQFLRNLTAVALTFWEGNAEEKALADKTLVKLSRDNGWGERIEVGEKD